MKKLLLSMTFLLTASLAASTPGLADSTHQRSDSHEHTSDTGGDGENIVSPFKKEQDTAQAAAEAATAANTGATAATTLAVRFLSTTVTYPCPSCPSCFSPVPYCFQDTPGIKDLQTGNVWFRSGNAGLPYGFLSILPNPLDTNGDTDGSHVFENAEQSEQALGRLTHTQAVDLATTIKEASNPDQMPVYAPVGCIGASGWHLPNSRDYQGLFDIASTWGFDGGGTPSATNSSGAAVTPADFFGFVWFQFLGTSHDIPVAGALAIQPYGYWTSDSAVSTRSRQTYAQYKYADFSLGVISNGGRDSNPYYALMVMNCTPYVP